MPAEGGFIETIEELKSTLKCGFKKPLNILGQLKNSFFCLRLPLKAKSSERAEGLMTFACAKTSSDLQL